MRAAILIVVALAFAGLQSVAGRSTMTTPPADGHPHEVRGPGNSAAASPKPVAAAPHDDHRHPGMFHAYFERLHKWAHSEDAK